MLTNSVRAQRKLAAMRTLFTGLLAAQGFWLTQTCRRHRRIDLIGVRPSEARLWRLRCVLMPQTVRLIGEVVPPEPLGWERQLQADLTAINNTLEWGHFTVQGGVIRYRTVLGLGGSTLTRPLAARLLAQTCKTLTQHRRTLAKLLDPDRAWSAITTDYDLLDFDWDLDLDLHTDIANSTATASAADQPATPAHPARDTGPWYDDADDDDVVPDDEEVARLLDDFDLPPDAPSPA